MKYFLLVIFLLLVREIVYTQDFVRNVLYGERYFNTDTLLVCFDKNGDIYPDYFIADSSLKQDSSLSNWYKKHPLVFEQIAQQYNCTFQEYSDTNIQILDDSILINLSKKINSKSIIDSSVTFMIHGFRKSFTQTRNEKTSGEDFEILEQTISKFTLSTLYVKVYWDAMYGCCFSKNISHNKVLFHLFEIAEQNATKVGKQFRKLLVDTQFDTINIISHSLGAKVACEALFNCSAESIGITPSNKCINICLIAPAIAGIKTFKNYYNRNSQINFKQKDNYRLAILYNEKDFVLKKKDSVIEVLGPGPYKYGNTTLGCNYHNAAIHLQDYFITNYPNSTITLFNLSSVGKCHHLGKCYCYGDNLKAMVNFMKE
ncbi:MAG: alpha/beta hydrolase [Parafilimonas sp.]